MPLLPLGKILLVRLRRLLGSNSSAEYVSFGPFGARQKRVTSMEESDMNTVSRARFRRVELNWWVP